MNSMIIVELERRVSYGGKSVEFKFKKVIIQGSIARCMNSVFTPEAIVLSRGNEDLDILQFVNTFTKHNITLTETRFLSPLLIFLL